MDKNPDAPICPTEDTTPPTPGFVSPEDNYVTTDTTVTFICNATDNYNLANIFVEVWQNNTTEFVKIAEAIENVNGTSASASFSTIVLAVGEYRWICGAEDEAGNSQIFGLAAGRNLTILSDLPEIPPNILIADTKNHRVIEVDPEKNIIWQYGITGERGSGYNELGEPYDAVRLSNGNTLITSKKNEVIEVTPDKEIVWEYTNLKKPHSAVRLSNGNTLITDSVRHRVIEVDESGEIVWQYMKRKGGDYKLSRPISAVRLLNGNTLITDDREDYVIEVNPDKEVVWQYNPDKLGRPSDANRLSNGNTLITDSKRHRVIEVDESGEIVWQYSGERRDELRNPTTAIRLPNGNTLITDTKNDRVIEVTPDKEIVWQYDGEEKNRNKLREPRNAKPIFL